MDKLFSAGKEFLEDRLQGDDDKRNDQQQPLAGGNKAHGGTYPSGGGFFDRDDDDDFREAKEEADKRAGASGSADLFSSIISSIGQQKGRLAEEHLDEEDAVKKHKKAYQDDDGDESEDSLGAAAALQALKLFNSGETGQKQGKGAFLGLALSEASKLFDDKEAKGKVSSGASKEGVIQKAGEYAMKMYLKSQGQQQGGLLGMASKFM